MSGKSGHAFLHGADKEEIPEDICKITRKTRKKTGKNWDDRAESAMLE